MLGVWTRRLSVLAAAATRPAACISNRAADRVHPLARDVQWASCDPASRVLSTSSAGGGGSKKRGSVPPQPPPATSTAAHTHPTGGISGHKEWPHDTTEVCMDKSGASHVHVEMLGATPPERPHDADRVTAEEAIGMHGLSASTTYLGEEPDEPQLMSPFKLDEIRRRLERSYEGGEELTPQDIARELDAEEVEELELQLEQTAAGPHAFDLEAGMDEVSIVDEKETPNHGHDPGIRVDELHPAFSPAQLQQGPLWSPSSDTTEESAAAAALSSAQSDREAHMEIARQTSKVNKPEDYPDAV